MTPNDNSLTQSENETYVRTHMPIGIHAGPGGNLDGAGQPDGYWVKVAETGKRPVVKSVDNYGPIFEALQYYDKYDIQDPALIYRLSTQGQNDGFDYDTPNWNVSPWAAAELHCMKTIAALPPEFDKRVWVELINEPDKDEDSQFPNKTADDFTTWLANFAIFATHYMHQRGYRVTMFGFSSGEPEIIDWENEKMLEFLQLATAPELENKVAISLHEYAYSMDLTKPLVPDGWLIGRFHKLFEACDNNNIPRPKTHISEFGWLKDDMPGPDEARAQLVHVLRTIYGPYPEIDIINIWYYGGGRNWNNLCNKAVKLLPILTHLAQNWSLQITKEPPEEPTGNKIDLAPYFTTNSQKTPAYGPIYMLENNWNQGPERCHIYQRTPGSPWTYVTKNRNREKRYIGEHYIYLQDDTSMNEKQFYTVKGPWLPRLMAPGQIFTRTETVAVYSKNGCAKETEYTRTSDIRFNGFDNNHGIGALEPIDTTVIHLTWLINGQPEEDYWYAEGIGLVQWKKSQRSEQSWLAEFVPNNEQPNDTNWPCQELLKETKPDLAPPPEEPTPAYILGANINWADTAINTEILSTSKLQFIYVRATTGDLAANPAYWKQTQILNDINIPTGSLHEWLGNKDPLDQADNFIKAVSQTEAQQMPPILHLKTPITEEINPKIPQEIAILMWLVYVEDRLAKPIIRTTPNTYEQYLKSNDQFDKYEICIEDWSDGTIPSLPIQLEDWLLWQHTITRGYQKYGLADNQLQLYRANYTSEIEFHEAYRTNWRKTKPPFFRSAPLRTQYNRKVYVLHPDLTTKQKQNVYEAAEIEGNTVCYSTDDAGATPCLRNEVIIIGYPPEKHTSIIEWFTTYYPTSSLTIQPPEYADRLAPGNDIDYPEETETNKEEGRIDKVKGLLDRFVAIVST